MRYRFDHFTVNGTINPNREIDVVVSEDVDLVAHYREEPTTSINVKNEEASDQTISVLTVIITEQEHTIPAGQTVVVPFNPDTDTIVLKPTT